MLITIFFNICCALRVFLQKQLLCNESGIRFVIQFGQRIGTGRTYLLLGGYIYTLSS